MVVARPTPIPITTQTGWNLDKTSFSESPTDISITVMARTTIPIPTEARTTTAEKVAPRILLQAAAVARSEVVMWDPSPRHQPDGCLILRSDPKKRLELLS